jgi:ArsR family transcriptional regulator
MELSKLSGYFKALSNPQRLKLFMMIYNKCESEKGKLKPNKECCPGIEKAFTTACSCLNLSRSTISHHFKELQNSGLVTCERIGQAFNCKVNYEAVKAVKEFIQ